MNSVLKEDVVSEINYNRFLPLWWPPYKWFPRESPSSPIKMAPSDVNMQTQWLDNKKRNSGASMRHALKIQSHLMTHLNTATSSSPQSTCKIYINKNEPMQIPPRNRCIKQVPDILISNILQKLDCQDSAGMRQIQTSVNTKRTSDISDKLILQMNKKSGSSCEYILARSRDKIGETNV